MNRRKFLGLSASSTTALMLPSLDVLAGLHPPNNTEIAGFGLKLLATKWGFAGTTDEFCSRVKREGYDGIEVWWPNEEKEQAELFNALKKYSLEVGLLCGVGESNFKEHLAGFKKMVNAAAANKVQRPLYINCHSGKDYFSFEENKQLVDYTTGLAITTGIKILHETHRSRMLFAAPVAKNFLEKIPALRLTLDISHWCNVSESYLQDQQATVDLALPRVDHIHARIGHPEGPQVADPRAPEWAAAVTAHFAWWDKVVEMKKQKGETLTFLTEFGPLDYMPSLPYTRQPVANQWEINVYMMQLLRKRYQL